MIEFFAGLSNDAAVLSSPIVAIAEFLAPFGKVASAIAKLIPFLPK